MTNRILMAAILALGAASFFGGCAGHDINETDPAVLYQDAQKDIENDRYQMAIDKLRIVRNKFPYSKYSIDAQLRIADVYFMQESYGEAAIAYESFRDLHPKHEKVPYAMFRVGKSHFKDIPSPLARDLTPAQKAVDGYTDFLHRYPDAPEAAEANKDLAEARRLLAEKELYIANFYWREDQYDSAKSRYEKILALYPDSDAAKLAKVRVDKIAAIEAREKANAQ